MGKRVKEHSRMTTRHHVPVSMAVMMASAMALFASVSGAETGVVRGVAPADQEFFMASGVTCTVNGAERVVPLARVNDDYCDCDDGKDEPGTAACSHLLGSTFYCDNGGFFPQSIHTSLLNDGLCDCCDGTDEFDKPAGAAQCANTCVEDAVAYKAKAEARLAEVEAGFQKRAQELESVVSAHFASIKESDALTEKTLASLALLKERVEVHKTREERREKQMRLEAARKNIPADQESNGGNGNTNGGASECVANAETGTTCENPDAPHEAGNAFQELDAASVTSEDIASTEHDGSDPNESLAKDANAADASEIRRVATMVQLADGTKVSLADYLRMDHSRSAKTLKEPPRTPDQMRREDFLGPLFNGDEAARKRIGLYALRTVGLIVSPVRAIAEAVLFIPRLLGDLASSSVLISPYLESLPSVDSVVQSPTFRRLGDGRVHEVYKAVAWGSRVVWDAPIFMYQYLFPTLDLDLTLPEAESLRNVLKEIDDDMEKLRKERETQQAELSFDFGPDKAFYALKNQCIEKQVEKYVYKLCPFQDVKQDYTNLGKWQDWGKTTSDDGRETTDYTVMKFANGLKCWNGPERSIQVTLECGATNEIVSVDEPSTCVYQMLARSYVACTPDVLALARAELAFWSKA